MTLSKDHRGKDHPEEQLAGSPNAARTAGGMPAKDEERQEDLAVEHAVTDLAREAGAEDAEEIIREELEARPAQATPVVVAKPPGDANVDSKLAPSASAVRESRRLLSTLRYSPHRMQLILLGIGLIAVVIAYMVGQVRLNTWNGSFFDAVEQKNVPEFGRQLLVFLGIVAFLLVLMVAQTWLQEMMKVRIREWLAHTLLDEWLAPGRAYRLNMTSELGTNPDQRIQEDTRHLTELTTELGVGLLQSTLMLVSFMGILWVLSEQIVFNFGGQETRIPGYMVWCAIGYAFLGSYLTWLVGYPLIRLNSDRYAREAELRFALVRVSESAESVSLYGGEEDERRQLNGAVGGVIQAMRRLSGALSRLAWITSGYGWLAIVVPIVVAAPGYFSGALSFGGLMMVVGAFTQVQQALNWFVQSFPKIADWRAALARISTFLEALGHVDDADPDHDRITLANHPRGGLAFEHVGIMLADGNVVIDEATAEIKRGERVLIKGESGSGKSTLFRAIAGLWPWGSGKILLPPRHQMEFMPQRPYLPLGTLRAAVSYPAGPDEYDREVIEAALERVGLRDFIPMLDKEERWDKAMSLGQQQRLAFARLLLHRPLWVFLDEATAALDDENQSVVMSIFEDEMPEVTIISIGHRPGLESFHTRTLQLVPSSTGAHLQRKPVSIYGATDRLLSRMLRMRGRWGRRGHSQPPL
jgi:vitamin B12/bleomycin/antimicrobial peptide transport system ATP-binding/permease protein